MSDSRGLALLVSLVALAGLTPDPARAASFPDDASAESARRGATYLASQQAADGSVPAGESAPSTADAIIAMAAGGEWEAVDVAVHYLEQTARRDATSGPYTGKIVSALVAAGENPRDFAGVDFMAKLADFYDEEDGNYAGVSLYADTLAMAAWIAGGETLPAKAVEYLKALQCIDGAWYWSGKCPIKDGRDTDTTALAISVLVAADGTNGLAVTTARNWLLDNQNETGCWGSNPPLGGSAAKDSANSCGLVLSAIVALGEDPNAAPWSDGSRNPAATLRTLQQDSGVFYSKKDNPGDFIYATKQAVPGLAGWKYPVSAPDEEEAGEATPPSTSPDGSGPGTTPTTGASRRNGATWQDTGDEPSTPPRAGGDEDARAERSATGELATTSMVRSQSVTTTTLPGSTETFDDTMELLAPRPTLRSPGDSVRVTIEPDPTRQPMRPAAGVAVGTLTSVTAGVGWYARRRLIRPALTILRAGK